MVTINLDKQTTNIKDSVYKAFKPSKENKIKRADFLKFISVFVDTNVLTAEQTENLTLYFEQKEYIPTTSKSNKSHSLEMKWVAENLPAFIETMPKDLKSNLKVRSRKTGYGYIPYLFIDVEGDERELCINWKNRTLQEKNELRKLQLQELENKTKVVETKNMTKVEAK